MDNAVPELFGESTYMMLRPGVFDDIVKVQRPYFQMYYSAGATRVEPNKLWQILLRARKRGIRLRAVSYNPNGLGITYAITAGVTLSSGGGWIDPPIKPGVRR